MPFDIESDNSELSIWLADNEANRRYYPDIQPAGDDSPMLSPIYNARNICNDSNGCPVYTELVKDIHWNEQSYPFWNGLEDACEDYGPSTPSTPGSFMSDKGAHSGKGFNRYPPFTMDEVTNMVNDIKNILGFQTDACISGFELLMSQLDSRSARMSPAVALKSLHKDYISGPHANFRKWFFACQMDAKEFTTDPTGDDEQPTVLTLQQAEQVWDAKYESMGDACRMADLIIYLCCWTEANQVRFMPECLAFIVKTAMSHYYSVIANKEENAQPMPDCFFLENIITPIYNCYVNYNYSCVNGIMIRLEGDHNDFIGYDDMNQLFWYHKGLERILVNVADANGHIDSVPLISLPSCEWYFHLSFVDWTPIFKKTYRESRTWLHLITNFSRTWILHLTVFWYYLSFNSPSLYTVGFDYLDPAPPVPFVRMCIMSFAGLIGPLITIIGLLGELRFVPRSSYGSPKVWPRLCFSIFCTIIIAAPLSAMLILNSWTPTAADVDHTLLNIFSGIMLAISIISSLYFTLKPMGSLFEYRPPWKSSNEKQKRQSLARRYFTAFFPSLGTKNTMLSWGMWILVFACKFLESYFFLALSVRDPIRELDIMHFDNICAQSSTFGIFFSAAYPRVILGVLILAEMMLFFLDTYLWYVIFNTLISVFITLTGSGSLWQPWRNIFSNLPRKISAKLLPPNVHSYEDTFSRESLKIIWNTIVQSLCMENLLDRDTSRRLLLPDSKSTDPKFFTIEADSKVFKHEHVNTSAYRRISFFAHSLSSPMQPAVRIRQLPAFTVLVPHYKEKMILSLHETIKRADDSRINILEYLKHLYPDEWRNFVNGAEHKYRAEDAFPDDTTVDSKSLHKSAVESLGFSSFDPNYTIQTRLWSSKRSQTLYRTVHGFSKYFEAIKVLYLAEHDMSDMDLNESEEVTEYLTKLAQSKCRILVSLQLYSKFTPKQLDDVETIFQTVPELHVSYVEHDPSSDTYHACLIDRTCPLLDSGRRAPKMKIKLSGNPILGDGKSDNQNSALPFYRGEFIQVVDANQDNYLEECLKIRNVLQEFEIDSFKPYEDLYSGKSGDSKPNNSPVAIVGAREYIFSENIGVLGDVAAGKEQTFGTLFARTLAQVGAKLHYGHPDFLNGVFMTTRGGISKGQRGLHLNEDIYAGMTAMLRGGRIKHCEYYQCGKGRDLGFVSILNFITKIGAGMGEQVLSREYFYLGTQLPFDRFTSFYFAHPGFHLNNTFITISIELLQFFMLLLCSVATSVTICTVTKDTKPTDLHEPSGCKNLLPLVDWIRRCVISIFSVFFVSLCPLIFQELTERGLVKSIIRVLRHLGSLSMLFEMFICRIYTKSFWEDLNVGGAKYVPTGRDLATSRFPMWKLYEGYSTEIISGIKSLCILIFCSAVLWDPSYIWFWVTTLSSIICPTLYNPQQFYLPSFITDHTNLLLWFFKSADGNSWYKFTKSNREKITGMKIRNSVNDYTKPNFRNTMFLRIGSALFSFLIFVLPYIFCTTQGTIDNMVYVGVKMALVCLLPYAANAAVLLLFFLISLATGLCKFKTTKPGLIYSIIVRFTSLLAFAVNWWLVVILEQGNLLNSLLLLAVTLTFQSLLNTAITVFFVRMQFPAEKSNDPWWQGTWHKQQLGIQTFAVMFKEFNAKLIENTQFACDFMVCHFILLLQIPLFLVPFMDTLHTFFLLWLKPKEQIKKRSLKFKFSDLLVALRFIIIQAVIIGFAIALFCLPGSILKYPVDFASSMFTAIGISN